LQPGSSLTAAELLDHCKQSVATYKIPRHLQFVASHEVPLTDTGKVSKLLVQKQLTATYQAGSKA
jgi:fatty-acyl-CoA synthase